MRRPTSTDDRVTDVTRRRLAALAAELGTAPPPSPATEAAEAPGATEGAGADPRQPAPVGRHALRPLGRGERLRGWLGDRTPAALQDRAHLGSAQVGVVALVVAVGLVLGAWMLVRAGGSSGEVAPPRVTSTGTAPVGGSSSPPASPGVSASPSGASPVGQQSGTAGTGTAGSGGKIVVDVVGKVRHPGIAVLPPGSRVVDAVRASGGLRRGVARRTVNLARVLNDGEQVLIGVGGGTTGVAPSVGAASGSSSASPGTPLVNINTADETALESLPGVGPVTAQAILQWRGDHGGFTSVDELLEVSGIGDATLAEIAPFVTL